MPLVAYKDLPSFARLKAEGRNILPAGRALSQEIRELHIGLLNMMPDAALEATERQFFRLVGESNQIAQFYMHPFTLPQIERGAEARAYIDRHYETFEQLKADGLDALIITGANVSDPDLTKAPFWEPLQEVMGWAWENTTSTLCSCLATHAVMEFKYGQHRKPLKKKLWGVYGHRVLDRKHPIMRGVNTVFDAPHSRFNEITPDQFEAAGMKVLAASAEGGAHVAVTPDGFRMVCFQGHPEYDTISLYKEYKREVTRFVNGAREKLPPYPEHTFSRALKKRLRQEVKSVRKGYEWNLSDEAVREMLENSWRDSARSVVGNWIGLVYQLTNMDRKLPFMEFVDPNNPLATV